MPTRNEYVRVFDANWENYTDARPGYPEALYADLISSTSIGKGSSILEIGCGVGTFTKGITNKAKERT